jgi:16S rRNA (cytosine967-C5)-methyltransferase
MRPFIPSSTKRGDTARSVALQVLFACEIGDAFVQEVLNDFLGKTKLSPADRRLTTQLAYGVLRRRSTLDALLQAVTTRPKYRVNPALWEILRLGALQLALLSHIPPHAAVHETVELAAAYVTPAAARKVKSFVNGVLRGLGRLLTAERVSAPAADALPVEGGEYRRLAKPMLPEPAAAPIKYVAAGFALPAWLVQRWAERFSWEECLRLGFWFAGPAPLWLRVNTLRTNRESFLKALEEASVRAVPGEHPQAVSLLDPAAVRDLPGYEQGWFAVQDESAMQVGSALAPAPGSRVLDLCAAPGGKTTHLAQLMNNRGEIIACDVDDRRLQTVSELAARLGITIVKPHRLHPERNDGPPAGPFDTILVDVPCSNTGVLGRRPEVRWRLKPDDFRRLVPLQTKLLLQGAERVRPGGSIVYSTCSFEPEENRQVVQAVLQALPDFVMEAEQEHVPGRPADGGYWARLRRQFA